MDEPDEDKGTCSILIFFKVVTMTITIREKEITLKYGFRALMIYENITQKSFQPQGLSDVVTFFYSVLVASAKGENITFDEFLDWLDDNPTSLSQFSDWLTEVYNHQAAVTNSGLKVEGKDDEGDAEKN